MSSEESPREATTEMTSLLGGESPSRSPPWKNFIFSAVYAVKVTWQQSYINWLLFLTPVALVASSHDWGAEAVFVLNFLVILPLSYVLSFATDELAMSTGQTVGALVNATFGNALEMIVSLEIYPPALVGWTWTGIDKSGGIGWHYGSDPGRDSNCSIEHGW